MKSVSQITKPVDLYFPSGEWIKQHPKNQEEYKEVNFTSEWQKHNPFPAQIIKQCTNLFQGKMSDDTSSTYEPIAPHVETFHEWTPNRYHLRSKKEDISLLTSKSPVTNTSEI
jgi:targeting protein for Xklp2